MRTDPFRELDRVAQQVFGTQTRPAAMPIDAYRRGEEFVVQFDLPGVEASSIDLTGERPHGTFSRQLFLAETLDSERLSAEYRDGVLTLRVPVKEQAKPRRVTVSSGDTNATAIDATASEER